MFSILSSAISNYRLGSVCVMSILLIITGCGDAGYDGEVAITEDSLREYTKELSDDKYGGRAPATEGGRMTVAYIQSEYEKIGLEAVGNSYRQPVPLVNTLPEPLYFRFDSEPLVWKDNFVMWSSRFREDIEISDLDLVFVGFGIVAPEYSWNDYEGLDAKDRVVVALINDPGFYSPESDRFKGKAMTYYGRWTYKIEEAARQGAAGIILIHETAPASYPWQTVRNSWTGWQSYLEEDDSDKLRVEGWITQEVAEGLFPRSGFDFEFIKNMALSDDFRPLLLETRISARVFNTVKRQSSDNVIGMIRGSEKPDEYVMFSAHWDHLGTDPELEGDDKIYNGALDNASGIAAMLTVAKAFMAEGNKPKRSVIFAAVTAEEQGLLGSEWMANNLPGFKPEQVVAVINIDGANLIGPTSDVELIGFNQSEDILDLVQWAADIDGRDVYPYSSPQSGSYFRSDHFSFAKVGIPGIYAESGIEHEEKGEMFMKEQVKNWISNHYHRPSDEYSESMNFAGAVLDTKMYYRMGARLANSDMWLGWNNNSEFRALRDQSAYK